MSDDMKLLPLSQDERDVIFDMRCPRMVAGDALHMVRLLIAVLRVEENDFCADAAAWMADRLATHIEILAVHVERKAP